MGSSIRWYHNHFDDIKDEFRRAERETQVPVNWMRLNYKFAPGRVIVLSQSLWSKLDNTDSWRIKSYEQLAHALKAYKKPIENMGFLLDALLVKRKCPLPVILAYVDDNGTQKLTLIDGNTRLSLCKVARIQPRVILLDYIRRDEDMQHDESSNYNSNSTLRSFRQGTWR